VGDTAILIGRLTSDLTVQGTRTTVDNLALAAPRCGRVSR